MENIGLGLLLMLVGVITVFVILLIVIYGSELLIRLLNRIAPADAPIKEAKEDVRPILEAAVQQITGGKGRLTNYTKL